VCAKLSGEPSDSRVELFTQNAYFCFQLIQVFLITTMSSSASAAVEKIADNPGSILPLLQSSLPTSSNFYINYFIVQGLALAAGVISQIVGFVIFKLLYKYLSSTPRSLYTKWANLSAISWGNVLPVYTNIAVISKYCLVDGLLCIVTNVTRGIFLFPLFLLANSHKLHISQIDANQFYK
jgi:calcium permeable stress-gated cation channel